MRYAARLFAAIAFLLAGARTLADDGSHVSLVPWKVIEPGAATGTPLTLFWVPASVDELRRSDLLTSEELTLFSSRCVAMRVVRFDDLDRLTALGIDAIPAAVLIDGEGGVIGSVDPRNGALVVSEVVALVRNELEERESAANARLDEARRAAEAQGVDEAIAIYRSVWEQRCVCPRQGRDARRAMKKIRR